MPPMPHKSFRQINIYMDKSTYDKGLLTVPLEFGYTIQFKIQPLVAINIEDEFVNKIPEYQTQLGMKPVKVDVATDAKLRPEILKAIKVRNVISDNIQYEEFTLGFVYANAQNPNNHKWMFEFRTKGQVTHILNFMGVSLKNMDISTLAWRDPPELGGIFHGRFLMTKDSVKTVLEDKAGWVTIHGHGGNKHKPKGDTSLIKDDVKEIRFRYHTKEDWWYFDMYGEKGETVAPPLRTRRILGQNVTMEGEIDWTRPKPRVITKMKVSDVNEIKQMADTIIIEGR